MLSFQLMASFLNSGRTSVCVKVHSDMGFLPAHIPHTCRVNGTMSRERKFFCTCELDIIFLPDVWKIMLTAEMMLLD